MIENALNMLAVGVPIALVGYWLAHYFSPRNIYKRRLKREFRP